MIADEVAMAKAFLKEEGMVVVAEVDEKVRVSPRESLPVI